MPSVFLSHSSRDKPFVRRLAGKLAEHGISVWIDEAELDIGDSLIERIGEGIRDADFVVAVISMNSVESNWVRKELRLAMTREVVGRQIRVLPLILDDCRARIPFYLTDKLYADFSDDSHFDEQLQRLLRAISRRSLECLEPESGGSESLGQVDIGSVIHDRGDDYVAHRWIKGLRGQGMKYLVLGMSFGLIGFVGLATLPQPARFLCIWPTLSAVFAAMAGMSMLSAALYLKVAIDRDRNVLLQLEAVGEESINLFTRKWKHWLAIGKGNRPYRIAMFFAILMYVMIFASAVMMLASIILLAVML